MNIKEKGKNKTYIGLVNFILVRVHLGINPIQQI